MKNFCEHVVSKYTAVQTDELSTTNRKWNSKMSRNAVHVTNNAAEALDLQHFVVRPLAHVK